jgi:hypothetical protein
MDGVTVECAAIFDRRLELSAKFLLAAWESGGPSFSSVPVAWLRINQNHFEIVLVEELGENVSRPMVGDLRLHSLEADPSGQLKPFEERYFVEHVVQVGSEFRHLASYSWVIGFANV